jgi:hypothetical protein
MRMIRPLLMALLAGAAALPVAAQQPPPGQPPAKRESDPTICTEPRREACTRIYLPVCATRRDGTRRTYGNACTACADPDVVSHVRGPCS